MKEVEAENLRRAAARRRAKGSPWTGRLLAQPPLEGGSRKWLWGVAGVLLLLLITFVSGVRVGKEFGRPSPKKESAFFLQDKAGQKIPIRIEEPAKGPSREGETKPVPPEPAEKQRGKEIQESKGNGQPRPAEKETASPSRTAAAQPAPTKPPAPAKGKYTLQIAALNSSEEAKELVNKYKARGYEAYAVTGTAAAKGALHRVRIGSFASLQEARQFAVEFEKKEKIKTIITNP